MFVAVIPALDKLNIMDLKTPRSAILSAVIFNALVIIALIPLALRGVRFRPMGAAAMLRRNLLIYGLGGIVVPFIGIKAIDIVVTALGVGSDVHRWAAIKIFLVMTRSSGRVPPRGHGTPAPSARGRRVAHQGHGRCRVGATGQQHSGKVVPPAVGGDYDALRARLEPWSDEPELIKTEQRKAYRRRTAHPTGGAGDAVTASTDRSHISKLNAVPGAACRRGVASRRGSRSS
jgi:hypothetical protein